MGVHEKEMTPLVWPCNMVHIIPSKSNIRILESWQPEITHPCGQHLNITLSLMYLRYSRMGGSSSVVYIAVYIVMVNGI